MEGTDLQAQVAVPSVALTVLRIVVHILPVQLSPCSKYRLYHCVNSEAISDGFAFSRQVRNQGNNSCHGRQSHNNDGYCTYPTPSQLYSSTNGARCEDR